MCGSQVSPGSVNSSSSIGTMIPIRSVFPFSLLVAAGITYRHINRGQRKREDVYSECLFLRVKAPIPRRPQQIFFQVWQSGLNEMCLPNPVTDRGNEAAMEQLRSVTHLKLESAFLASSMWRVQKGAKSFY